MGLDLGNAWDSFKEGTKEIAEVAHDKTSEFHEKYVSKVIPDCGKYGDAAKFIAEMAPGVEEYNAIVEGDWTAFAIAAGIDVTAIAVGIATAGTGYTAIKAGRAAAKVGVKVATKEIAEAGAKKVVKTIAKEGTEKITKEVIESGTQKVVKEIAESGAQKAVKEIVEEGTEKVIKETVESSAKKAVKEVAEESTEIIVKETVEAGTEKTAKEITEKVAEEGTEKIVKETVEAGTEKTAKEITEKVATKGVKEVGERIDKTLIPNYLKEVENITNREIKPQQMEKLKKALDNQEFTKLDKEKSELHKKLFNNARNKLIKEWEMNTGDKWPVYAEDVLDDAGKILRRAGQRYDAHHLIESSFGGPNAWWNLHPAAFPTEHQAGIHATGKLANLIF